MKSLSRIDYSVLKEYLQFQERLQRFVPRLVQLLAEWTETFPYDFRDERVMAHVKSITQKVASVDATARQEVSALLQNLLLRLTALERYEEGLARLATESGAQQLSQVQSIFLARKCFLKKIYYLKKLPADFVYQS